MFSEVSSRAGNSVEQAFFRIVKAFGRREFHGETEWIGVGFSKLLEWINSCVFSNDHAHVMGVHEDNFLMSLPEVEASHRWKFSSGDENNEQVTVDIATSETINLKKKQ